MSDQILDLDALVPAPAKVKFGGQTIEIQPPKTGDFLQLGYLGQRLKDGEALPREALDKIINDLTAHIHKMVPELGEAELSVAQLLGLVTLISNMGIPPDSTELKERGISVGEPEKKSQE